MTSEEEIGHLSQQQIVRLARNIAADNMESIAEGYMNISPEAVKNLRLDAWNAETFNREILRIWANRNPENQVEVIGFNFSNFNVGLLFFLCSLFKPLSLFCL